MSLHPPIRLRDWVLEWTTGDAPSRKYFYSKADLLCFFMQVKAKLPAELQLDEYDDGRRFFGVFGDLGVAIWIHQLEWEDVVDRFPRLVAHMICCSLGYCSPLSAGRIILDAARGGSNWCEWIDSCYNADPRPALKRAISDRHSHHGYMADYPRARGIVEHVRTGGPNPDLGSWS